MPTSTPTPTATAGPITTQEVNDLLEPIRQKYMLPSLAGTIVTSKGLIAIGGVGVRKAGTTIPVEASDLWHLGSDTKAMTATLIASLVQQGKLTWEMTLGEVFPDLASAIHPDFRKVSVLHLLSHRAGLPRDLTWSAISPMGNVQEQRATVVKIATQVAPLSPPGTKYEYSNIGYVLAGAMAEKITGESWENLITRFLFQPLGMRDVGFGGTGTPGKIDQPWPHLGDGSPMPINGPMMDNPPVLGPAGTVHATLTDWSKYIADQLRGARGERALLLPDAYRQLFTPPFGGEYALGWYITQRSWAGGMAFTHSGSNVMNYSVVWGGPQRDVAVLVTINQGGDRAAKASDEAAGKLIEKFYSRR